LQPYWRKLPPGVGGPAVALDEECEGEGERCGGSECGGAELKAEAVKVVAPKSQ